MWPRPPRFGSAVDRPVRLCRPASGDREQGDEVGGGVDRVIGAADAVPYIDTTAHWLVAVNLLAGSLAGAWAGASWATRMATATLHKVLAGLLVLMAHLGSTTTTLSTASAFPEKFKPSSAWPPDSPSGPSLPSMGGRLGRAADPHHRAAVRPRHQSRRQPVRGDLPTRDHGGDGGHVVAQRAAAGVAG
jgi:hypothetical protein